MESPSLKKIAVIGAGCSGLAVLKGLQDYGFRNIVCYEQNEEIGGNWLYKPEISHSSVFDTTHIISSKKMSEFRDYPMPEGYPDYPSHAQVLSYFNDYAEHFGLKRYIHFGQKVLSIQLEEGTWTVEALNSSSSTYDFLILANGHHSVPRHPELPGDFSGEYLHAHQFKNNSPFHGKRVLVIGGGNSACDIAVECGRVGSFVSISMRRPHYIVPKFIMGKPTDLYNDQMRWIPEIIARPLRKLSLKLQIGSYHNYGLEDPDFHVKYDHPTVNSELLYFLRHGKVNPRKGIESVIGKTVTFADGQSEDYDVIIAATGYKIATPFFKDTMPDYSESEEVDLYLRMFHPNFPSLIYAGLVQPQGAIWPLVEAQSKLMAHYIGGTWHWPSNIQQLIQEEVQDIKEKYLARKRHTIEVDFHDYLHLIESLTPAPNSQPSTPINLS